MARAALRVWRQEVLPQLTPGTIVRADPTQSESEKTAGSSDAGENQRARIYQLAGFSKQGPEGLTGVVVQDENGQNKLIPTDYTAEDRESQMNEYYIQMNDLNLNTDEQEIVYDMLFS